MNTVLDRASLKISRLLKAKRLSSQIDADSKAAGLTVEKIIRDVEKLIGEDSNGRSSHTRRNRH